MIADSPNLELDLGLDGAADEGATLEANQERVIAAIASAKLDTVQHRVAWILNQIPEARDSDIRLQLEYWKQFHSDIYAGGSIEPEDMYHLPRLTSLSRARAKIQNSYQLFQASEAVRAFRGTLRESERTKAASQRPNAPLYQVAADESGKTGKFLIWGSVWVLHAPEVLTITRKVGEWKDARKFNGEFHFKEIEKGNVDHYLAFVDFVHSELSSAVTFRSISVEQHGVKDRKALDVLLYHLLVKGVDHEDQTLRAPLPRRLQVWKDNDEPGRDKLIMAELRDRMIQAGASRFGGQLLPEEFQAFDSKSSVLLQMADLYAGSLNRVLNEAGSAKPKDLVAGRLLELLGTPLGPQQTEQVDGMAVHFAL